MTEKFPYYICCSRCGRVLSKSYEGTKAYVHCPKCKAELYYEVGEDVSTIQIVKKSKNQPVPSKSA